MSHRRDCPDDYEARSRARSDASWDVQRHDRYDYRRPYECDEANNAYRRAYAYEADRLEEERASERRAQQRREERRMEEEYYARAAEEEYYAQLQAAEEEAYWAEEQWRAAAIAGWRP